MKTLLTLIAGFALTTSAMALDLKSGTAYRIVSQSYPGSTICVGTEHGAIPYIYSNMKYDGTCKDAYWYFDVQKDGSYTIRNAATKEYITYTTERLAGACKGLKLTTKDEGAASHWYIEEYAGGYCMIYTQDAAALAKGDPYWNQRVNASDNYLLGTYSYGSGPNSMFSITDDVVTPDPGPEPEPEPEPEPTYTVLDGGADAIVVRQTGNRMTIVPKDYVENYTIQGNVVTMQLTEGSTLTFPQSVSLDLNVFPDEADLPMFTSYKFNNKFNYQVFTDVEATDPTASDITLSVGAIGKWLTASFQLSDKEAAVFVGDSLQQSKVTRQRFAHPVRYTIGYEGWRRVELRDYTLDGAETDDIRLAFAPYGRQQTVTVDWLSDRPTSKTGVPRIDITLTDHRDAQWGDSDGWYGWDNLDFYWLGQEGKTTYVNAEITIDGGGTFPDMDVTPILIKGRGNSTWRSYYYEKNPYHFKFETKQKPLGLTAGKHWILLSNKQTGSMLTNAIGHRVADMMGGIAPCHIVPVDLYINDSYRGSYNLCEKVGFGNNSIDLDDDTNAAMVELDTYTDEKIYHDDWYYLSTKMKDPDFDDTYDGLLTPSLVMNDWNNLLQKAFLNEDIAPYVDVDRLAAYLAANEMITNCELKHPKSVYAYSADVTDGFSLEADADATPWVFGPLWDCDWGFGYEQEKTYFKVNQSRLFFSTLIDGGESSGRAKTLWNALRDNEAVRASYNRKWYDFATVRLPELLDFCDDYYAFAARSFDENTNNETIQRDYTDYASQAEDAKAWLQKRAAYVLKNNKYVPEPPGVEPQKEYPDPEGPVTGNLIDPEGIRNLSTSQPDDLLTPTYNLHGRRVKANTHGIIVTRSNKTLR